MVETELRSARDLNLQPGELYLAREPDDPADHSGILRGRHILEPRLGVGALCHGVLPRCPHEAVRLESPEGTAMWTSAFATWPSSSTRSASVAQETGSETVRRRRCAAGDREVRWQAHRRRTELPGRARSSGGGRFRRARLRPGRHRGRSIHFHTGTGEVLLQPARPMRTTGSAPDETAGLSL